MSVTGWRGGSTAGSDAGSAWVEPCEGEGEGEGEGASEAEGAAEVEGGQPLGQARSALALPPETEASMAIWATRLANAGGNAGRSAGATHS